MTTATPARDAARLRDLARLREVTATLTPQEAAMLCGYAEGLAAGRSQK